MLKAIQAPLPCFGLDQKVSDPKCKACPHFVDCQRCMGTRANRITLDELTFDFLPKGIPRKADYEQHQGRDLNETYQTCYREVFGTNPGETLGRLSNQVLNMARQAKVNIRMYMLTNMVGHRLTWPEIDFTVNRLVDNRALYRAKVYADACRERYGTVDGHALDNLTGENTAAFSLDNRMLNSEKLAGEWIIKWKLDHEGPPYIAMFRALEAKLDPNWLAIEPRYHAYILEIIETPSTEDEHAVADAMRRLKRRKHEARGNFMARERVMPEAIASVLDAFGYGPQDFEIPNQPVTDSLKFWHRLSLAIQHFECLKFIDLGEGYYAR